MLKISLYHNFYVAFYVHINSYRYCKDQSNRVNSLQRLELEKCFQECKSHVFRMR